MADQRSEVLAGLGVAQIGFVVRELATAVARFSAVWPAGPWKVYEWGPETIPVLNCGRAAASCRWRVALSSTVPQFEFIESLVGPNIYDAWLEQNGEGLHHVAVSVPSVVDAIRSLAACELEPIASGLGVGVDGDGGFAYFDTTDDLGVILELIEIPRRRRDPDLIWP